MAIFWLAYMVWRETPSANSVPCQWLPCVAMDTVTGPSSWMMRLTVSMPGFTGTPEMP